MQITPENVADGYRAKVNYLLYGTANPCLNLKRHDIKTAREQQTLQLTINHRHVDIIEEVFLDALVYRDALRECLTHLEMLPDLQVKCEEPNIIKASTKGMITKIKTMLGFMTVNMSEAVAGDILHLRCGGELVAESNHRDRGKYIDIRIEGQNMPECFTRDGKFYAGMESPFDVIRIEKRDMLGE